MDERRELEPSEHAPLEVLARKRVRARGEFIVHAVMFLVGNLGVYAIWQLTAARYPWFLWVLVGWGIAVVAHGLTVFLGPGSAGEEHAIARELARLRPRHHAR
jgi:hypothetical protein